jgi:DNA-binding CsgD family transcriptional regulator
VKITRETAETPEIVFENVNLTDREKEIGKLLLTDRPLKEIAHILELSYSGANFHVQNLYAKLGVQNRTELLVKRNKEKHR